MGFLRGLSPAYMRATPPINDWVAELVEADDDPARLRVRRAARAGGGRLHRRRVPPQLAPRRRTSEMLAALWRESPLPRLAPGERLATMASLLHRDRVRPHARRRADRGLRCCRRGEWVATYLRAYVRPVVHCMHPPRPGVHAARREPHPRAGGPRADPGVHEGHRRGGRGDERRPAAAGRDRADTSVGPRPASRRWPCTPTSSTASCGTSPASSTATACCPGRVLGARRRLSPSTRRPPPGAAGAFAGDLFTARVRPLVPQPAPAEGHSADGRPVRPGRVADLRRHAGQPDRPIRPMTVLRDDWGIPHLRADSVLELAFAQGHNAATDRGGRSSSTGCTPRGAPPRCSARPVCGWDPFARQALLDDTARRCFDRLDAETRAWCEAYVDGVRAGLTHSGIPADWSPWTPLGIFLVQHVLFGAFPGKLWRARVVATLGDRRAGPARRGGPGAVGQQRLGRRRRAHGERQADHRRRPAPDPGVAGRLPAGAPQLPGVRRRRVRVSGRSGHPALRPCR